MAFRALPQSVSVAWSLKRTLQVSVPEASPVVPANVISILEYHTPSARVTVAVSVTTRLHNKTAQKKEERRVSFSSKKVTK